MSRAVNRRHVLASAAALGVTASVASLGAAQAADIAVNHQPLSLEALGTLNRFHTLARQMPGDWSGMGIEAVEQDGDDGFHMQLPYMFYALAVAQHARTPAYRELYRGSMDRLLEKMKRNEVWDYWEHESSGARVFGEHAHHLQRPAYADPIKYANVEYSGHVHAMMGLYESLYREGKWERPGSFTLRRITPAGAVESFVYDLPKVNQAMLEQFRTTGYLGLECEPDAIYPTTCNQFPIAGFIHFDQLNGTSYAKEVIPRHIDAWKKISTLYRLDGAAQVASVIYASRQEVGLSDGTAFGKAQFMNVYVRDYVQAIYPRWREELFDIDPQGVLVVKDVPRGGLVKVSGEPAAAKPRPSAPEGELRGSNEQLAHKVAPAAAEVGDQRLVEAAIRFADRHNPPVWKDGELYYERNDEHGTPRFLNRRASILIGSGRFWTKDAYHNLYNRPWDSAARAAPQVQAVDYPRVLVSQAFHDPASDVLTVTVLPHGVLPGSEHPKALTTQFDIVNLDPRKTYQVRRDGAAAGRFSKGRAEPSGGATIDGPAGTLRIRTALAGAPQTFVISPV